MSTFTRSIANLLIVFFVISALLGLILFNVELRAFNPATYKRALASENFYRQFPLLIGELLNRNIAGNAPAFLNHISVNQWQVLIEDVLPEQQIRSMTDESIDQVFACLNGETQIPGISLIPLKNSLAGPAGLKAALVIIRSQPDCTIQQVAIMLYSFGQELCNPPASILDLLHPVIQSQLRAAVPAIPDTVSILQTTNNGPLEPMLNSLRVTRLLMRLSPLLPIAILLTITIIAVRTLKDWLVWWGWPLTLTGLFGIPINIAIAPFFRWILEVWLSKHLTLSIPAEIAASLRKVVEAALRDMLKPAVGESVVLFFLGLVMIIISTIFNSRDKKKLLTSEAKTQGF
jgi:hypothetical protein